jgi:hypothetical protein
VATSNTIYGIINDAMHDAGYLEEGQEPNSEQLATYFRRLNDIINLWQTQGLKLFLQEELVVPLVAGTAMYSLGPTGTIVMPKPSRVLQANVVSPSGIQRPLVAMSWNDWMTLSNRTQQGTISSYFVDKQVDMLKVHFWNVPDAGEALNSVHLLIQRQINNAINLQEGMDFPQEWRIALRWGLADDICTGQPQAIMERCAARANAFREALEDWDVEDVATSFAPDSRSSYGVAGRFR